MRKSQRNKSKLSRFVYYKWSGPIVIIPFIVLAVGIYAYIETNNEFFSSWSCDTIRDYMLNIDVPAQFPKHNDLTSDQHIKLHKIYQECVDNTRFFTPVPNP